LRLQEAAALDEVIRNERLAALATTEEAARQALEAQRVRREALAARAAAERRQLAEARRANIEGRLMQEVRAARAKSINIVVIFII
jgi:hypothetical protein